MMKTDLFKGFHSSPEIIRLAVMMYVRFPLSLRNADGAEAGNRTLHSRPKADEVGGSCSTGIECAKVQLSSTAWKGAPS